MHHLIYIMFLMEQIKLLVYLCSTYCTYTRVVTLLKFVFQFPTMLQGISLNIFSLEIFL